MNYTFVLLQLANQISFKQNQDRILANTHPRRTPAIVLVLVQRRKL